VADLTDEVTRRLEAADASPATITLAVAACRDDDALAAAVDDTDAGQAPDDADDDASSPPTATYLSRIRVAGFRGIGPEAELELPPGPGLTLVVGRNGSGKSSFAEAVEFALTGDNARWRSRSKVWRDGWRNLHAHDTSHVVADFLVDGQRGPTTVERRWDADADLDGATLSVRSSDGDTSLGELGWQQGLDVYRPFLPYSELGAMVDDGPTALHDALSTVLGLEQLTAAGKRLKDLRLGRERAVKDVTKAGRELADDLDDVDDDRATTAAEQLRAKRPDLDALEGLVAGSGDTTDRSLELLRQLAGLRGPDLAAARRTSAALTEAAAAVADHAGTDAARDLEIAELLAAARRTHAEHGDQDCPVCGGAPLDAAWAKTAEHREAELREAAAAGRQAHKQLETARRDVRQLVGPAPGTVERAGVAGVETDQVLAAYRAWGAVAAEPDAREQASALLTAADELTDALAALRTQAAELLRIREDRWRPYATRVASWLGDARGAAEAARIVPDLKAAEKAVAQVLDELRTERWTPIAEHARQVWDALRQRSSVKVEDVALAGTGVRRRVEVQVTVDGVEGAALGVMSQGELHALALSLFLPRATLPESPFRFVVIDDPVQSMDPARVDGLARVLDAVAMERQVVVFTHDDRLPDAVRRLGITATILEVSRGLGSHVEVRPTHTPWRRHLDDARALALTEGVPDQVRRDVVPGFCRMALEAACIDVVRRRELADGRPHEDVEVELASATRLLPLLALTLFGDSQRGNRVYHQLDEHGPWATAAVKACNAGAHTRVAADPVQLVRDVERLIKRLAA
jgi:recombinational DNA repair ATPase RecF